MRPSILVVAAAFGAGYVLGAKAGRERYEQLVEAGRTAAATGRVAAAIAGAAARTVAAGAQLGRQVLGRAKGDEIVLPDTDAAYEVRPPSTT